MRNYFLGLCLLFALCFTACSHSDDSVDVLIIGGGASGVTAGIQSARMGAATLIVEETEWLGGMLTSAGVSAVDGNYDLPAGLFGEFREHLADYYGGLDSLKTGWVSAVLFEPSVGNKIFHEMVDAEKNLKVWHNATLVKLEREKDVWIAQIQMKDNTIKKIHAKILIDGTELGDIAKMCGVKYDVGMESRHDTKEDIAPEEKNNIVQDITYVAILKDYGKDVTIPCPEGYNKDEFACACASHVCITPKEPDRVWSKDMMITYGKLPNNKYMINWPIEGNDYYVNLIEMTREEREEALKYAKHYIQNGLLFCRMMDEAGSFASLAEYRRVRKIGAIYNDSGKNRAEVVSEFAVQSGYMDESVSADELLTIAQRNRSIVSLYRTEQDEDGEETGEDVTRDDSWNYAEILWNGIQAKAVTAAFEQLSYKEQWYLEKRNAICMTCGRVSPLSTQSTFEDLAVDFEGTTASGAERFYRRTLDKLRLKLLESGVIHTVTLKQTERRKKNKKIAAAVYLYQADNDGEWGKLRFDFENGTAEIVKLADWDTVKSNIFAKTAIRFAQGLPETRLLKSTVVPFEMERLDLI